MTDGRFTFTAAVRVIVGVHDRTAHRRTGTEVTGLTRFAHADDLVFEISDLTDRRLASHGNESHFAGRHFDCRIRALFCHDLRRDTRASCDLTAATGLHLDIMDHRTDRDVRKRKRVADFDIGFLSAENLVADVQTDGSENVSLFAVRIDEERNVRAAVGIVLNALNRCGNAVFVPLKINDTVLSLIAAADVTNGDFALVVSSARLALILDRKSVV